MAENKSMSEKREEIKEQFYDNIIIDSVMKIIYDYKHNKKGVAIKIGTIFLLSIIASGYMGEMFLKAQGKIKKVYIEPTSLLYGAFFTSAGLICFFLLFIGINVALIQMGMLFSKDAEYNKEYNYDKSKRGTQGSAHFLTEAEEEAAFHRSKDIMTFKHDILGMDAFGYMVARIDKEATNDNLAAFGSSGSQKSTAIMFLLICQAIRRGESIITTDTKGEMYSLALNIAKKNGYETRVINFMPGYLSNSDGVDVVSIIKPTDSKAEEDCDKVVESIMLNTNDGMKIDFFYKAETNLLSAIVRFVVFSKTFLEQDKNLATIYDIISNSDVDKIAALFKNIKPSHPAYKPFSIWLSNEKIRADALAGLGIRLSKLSTPTVKAVVSNNEVDFTLPGRKKCIYFIVLSDRDDTYRFLSSLTVTTLLNQLMEFADSTPRHKLPKKTHFIIDEASACGAIPRFERYLSTVRSRNITIKFATQDIGQLEDMYPGKGYKSVLNNCQMQLLLGTSDDVTAKHFSDLAGYETVISKSEAYEERRTNIFKIHDKVRVSKGETKKALIPVDDIYHMSNDKMILYIKGEPGVIKLSKMPYYKNYPGSNYRYYNDGEQHKCFYNGYPLMPYIGYDNIFDHIPEWYEEYERTIELMERREKASGEAPIDVGKRR